MTSHQAHTAGVITVGRVEIAYDQAVSWVRDYTDADRNQAAQSKKPYAFPAYDTYNADSNHPYEITDADLLAPVLLNVDVSVRSFYGLQRVRLQLEQALAQIEPGTRLEDPGMTKERIASLVKPMYAVLDNPATRPSGVRTTTLSKILHRKRPQFLVLHDKWVRACYWGDDDNAIVKRDQTRAASDYMVAITNAIAADLLAGQYRLDHLIDDVPSSATLTHVRILDILAWSSKGLEVA